MNNLHKTVRAVLLVWKTEIIVACTSFMH